MTVRAGVAYLKFLRAFLSCLRACLRDFFVSLAAVSATSAKLSRAVSAASASDSRAVSAAPTRVSRASSAKEASESFQSSLLSAT